MRRVNDPADPTRCARSFAHEQCWNQAVEGSSYCEVHGGQIAQVNSNAVRLYHLNDARYRQRQAQLDDQDHLRILNELIAFVTLLIQRRGNLITDDPADLSESIGPWSLLHVTKTRLLKSERLMKQNLSVLQSKSKLVTLGRQIIQIVVEELPEVDDAEHILTAIGQQMMQAIISANNKSDIQKVALPQIEVSTRPVFQFANVEDQNRIDELTKHELIKSNCEDISWQIIVIERRWNSIKTDLDFSRAIPQICDTLKTLEGTIKEAFKAEQTLGRLLDPETMRRLATAIIAIITENLDHLPSHEKIIDRICHRIANTITNTKRRDEELKAMPLLE